MNLMYVYININFISARNLIKNVKVLLYIVKNATYLELLNSDC